MTLTREQIMTLHPGPETDERIAAHLSFRTDDPSALYSTQIHDAWIVVDEMARRGFHLALEDCRLQDKRPGDWIAYYWTKDGHSTADGVGQSPAHAICLATLLAICR